MVSSVLLFLNIGTPELILILFAALLLFGGNKLPELARGLGKGIREFKDASEDVKREIHNQINNFDEKIKEDKIIQNEEYSLSAEDSNKSETRQHETESNPVISEKLEEGALTPPLSITTNADASAVAAVPSKEINQGKINH
ncbi:MAG: twin-arginine translocase TatA/TatE family subunit [Sphingobacteriaceae bacterium]